MPGRPVDVNFAFHCLKELFNIHGDIANMEFSIIIRTCCLFNSTFHGLTQKAITGLLNVISVVMVVRNRLALLVFFQFIKLH